MKRKDAQILEKIRAAVGKSKLSQEDKEFFFNYLLTKKKFNLSKRWNWAVILKATNIPLLTFKRALQTLIDEKVAKAVEKLSEKDWENAVIYVTGKPQIKITELKNQIQELGFQHAKVYSDKVTHVVIGMNSPDSNLLLDKTFIPITEAQLQQRFSKTQPQFLRETANEDGGKEMIDNLGKLLTSPDLASVKVGVEMIKSGGMPPSLFEELLIVQKTTTDNEIRKVVQKLLEVEAPLEWKPFVRDRLSFKIVRSGDSEIAIRRQIAAVAKRIKPTMAAKFSMVLYRHTGRGLRYALTARLAKGLKEEAYQLLLKDNHFNFSKGLGADYVQDVYYLPGASVSLPVLALELAPIYSLSLRGCLYENVNEDIVEFQDLKSLDYSGNFLTTLPSYFSELENLQTIDLRNNMFEQFPNILTKMPNLKKIDLRNSRTDKEYQPLEIPTEFKEKNPDCIVLV